MKKIVINVCHGGFGLSKRAMKMMGYVPDGEYDYHCEVKRDDPKLIEVVEKLGDKAGSRWSTLKIVEIPNKVKWEIKEYGGAEWVAEVHRTWR